MVAKVMASADTLITQPTRGRVVPELNDTSIRELFVYSYRVLYKIYKNEREVHILAVLHGKRLLSSLDRFPDSNQ